MSDHQPTAVETIDQLFARAIDARDDGEDKLAVELFSQLVQLAPDNFDFRFKYIESLTKHAAWPQADQACLDAAGHFDNKMPFMLEWSRIPDFLCDWNESLGRRRYILERFPVGDYKESIHAVTEQILPLLECADRSAAKNLIDRYWPDIVEICKAPRQVMDGLLALCLFDKAEQFCKRVLEVYGANVVDGLNFNNALTLAKDARANQEATKNLFPGIRLMSLGQNCLSYALPTRWGLNQFGGSDDEITPFDLGSFPKTFAMELIKSDFSSFYDKSKFVTSTAERGMPMVRYEPFWIPFYHERGRWWIDGSMEPLHGHLLRQVETFRRQSTAGKKLFIFCLCGEGDLDALIDEASSLLAPHCRLLIIDVLKTSCAPKPHPHVTYLHRPYPGDYSWNWIGDYTSDRGMAFERDIVKNIKAELQTLAQNSAAPRHAPVSPERPEKALTRFISLGGDCQPAQQIKHHGGGAKHFFDWMIVPVTTVDRLIKHQFAGFGGAADLVPIYNGDHLHRVVEAKNNVEFMHDFKTFSAAEIADFQHKYDYLSKKFLALLGEAPETLCFIRRWVQVDGPEDETKARALYQTVQARCPGSHFLYLHNDESRGRVIDGFYRSAYLPQSGTDWEGDHAAWAELLRSFATQQPLV